MNELTQIDQNHSSIMRGLTEKQRGFVFARVWKGYNLTDSARDAGYSATSNNSLAVIGHNLARDPRVQEAIREETNKLKDSEGANSLRTLIAIRDDPTAEKSVRRKCATDILDRAGYHIQTEHTINVHKRDLSTDEMIQKVIQLSKNLGLDPKKLLGAAGVIDVEFEEIPCELTGEEKKTATARERDNSLRRRRRKMTPEQLAAHKAQMATERTARAKAEYQKHNRQQEDGDILEAGSQPLADEDDLSDIFQI